MAEEAGKSVDALTVEERLTNLYDRALQGFEEAYETLRQWKENHEGFNLLDPELLELKKDVENANQWLNDAARRWKDAHDTGRATKKARYAGDVHRMSTCMARALMKRISDTNCDSIFDIETVVVLPFPSLVQIPNRFEVTDGSFKYQARSELNRLYDKVLRFWREGRFAMVQMVGTIGYGKSHMLAVLVLLLMKNHPKDRFGTLPFVCFIPDCRELLCGEYDVVRILQENILLNIPNFNGPLNTIEDVVQAMTGQSVILVADQWNSIDGDARKCELARERLDRCLGTSVRVKIHGVSMDAETRIELLHKNTSEDRNMYLGGFNNDEFRVWLRHQPAIFTDGKNQEELARLTGKVPLLLSVFAHSYNQGASWQQILQRAEVDSIVQDWLYMLKQYYEKIDGDQLWQVFSRSVDWILDSSIIDPRFFYDDSSVRVCATSEIVWRLLYRVWSTKATRDALLTRWPDLLQASRNRPSLGFYVEEIIKAKICRNGVLGIYAKPNGRPIKRHAFKPGDERFELETAIETRTRFSCWILMDPKTFHYPGVDMILMTDTDIVGINVAIAKAHAPLELFFEIWRPLAESNKMSIRGLIVAPHDFHDRQEENVDVVLLKDVYYELWKKINPGNRVPIQDQACHCTTGCGTGHCGCRKRGKHCNPHQCLCVDCTNKVVPRVGATATIEHVPNQAEEGESETGSRRHETEPRKRSVRKPKSQK